MNANDRALSAIRAKCLDCSGKSVREVERCLVKDCPLYPFRRGSMPEEKKRITKLRGQIGIKDILEA